MATYSVFLGLSVLSLSDRHTEPLTLDGLIWLQDLLLLESWEAPIGSDWCKLKLRHCIIVSAER